MVGGASGLGWGRGVVRRWGCRRGEAAGGVPAGGVAPAGRMELPGVGAGSWSGWVVGDGEELEVEDEVGLGGDDGRAAGFAVGELVGDEEATLSADVHAFKAGVPAGDDLVGAVGEGDGLWACRRVVPMEESNLVPSVR